MKKIIDSFVLLGSLLVLSSLFVSCDDFLDIRPKKIVIPETCEDYERLLNDLYITRGSETYQNYLTDDLYLDDNESAPRGGFHTSAGYARNLYSFQSEIFGESEEDTFWEGSYKRIYTYNTIIEFVMQSTRATEEKKLSVYSEALVGRAFEYLNLVNGYAKHYDKQTASADPGVPLILKPDIALSNLTRASVQEVYDQVLSDLNEAEKNLPTTPVGNAYRATKAACKSLKARMYLYMGDYQKALENALSALNEKSVLIDYKEHRVIDPTRLFGRNTLPQGPDNPETIYLREVPNIMGLNSFVFGSEDLISIFDTENDQRYKIYFSYQYSTQTYDKPLWLPYIRPNVGMSTPEVFLIAAECEARLGRTADALKHLNALRSNRLLNYQPVETQDQTQLLKLILDERRREMIFVGGTRLIDLKRMAKEPNGVKKITHKVGQQQYAINTNDPKMVLPIPLKVLTYNPNMVPNER